MAFKMSPPKTPTKSLSKTNRFSPSKGLEKEISSLTNGPNRDNENDYVFNFGKHFGKTFKNVVSQNGGYITWITENEVYKAPNRSELKAALVANGYLDEKETKDASSSSPPTEPIPKTDVKSDYVLQINPYKGNNICEVPWSFLEWILEKTDMAQKDHKLAEALHDLGVSGSMQLKDGWQPPKLSLAPPIFYENMLEDPLWITDWDVKRYFPDAGKLYLQLPQVGGSNSRRWLYHVWTLVKDHKSVDAANSYLGDFKHKMEIRTWEIEGALGLGGLECCGGGSKNDEDRFGGQDMDPSFKQFLVDFQKNKINDEVNMRPARDILEDHESYCDMLSNMQQYEEEEE